MKHLLNGVAIAAALAIAVPAWAQSTPMTPAPKAAAAAPAAAMPAQKHHAVHHSTMARHGKMMSKTGGVSTTQNLNREELSRIQGGAVPMAQPMMPSPSTHAGPSMGQPMAPPPPR